MSTIEKHDMTQGKILLPLVSFTIPLVLGNLFQLTYNAADSVIVGKYVGEQALAAVGTSTQLLTRPILIISFGMVDLDYFIASDNYFDIGRAEIIADF